MKKSVLLVLLSGLVQFALATAMSDAVAAMAERSWRPVSTLGLTGDLLHSGPVMDVNYAFSNDANWDPVSRQILYLGGPHGSAMIFNAYTEPENMWRAEDISGLGNHSWDGATIDPGKGYLYLYQESGIFRWNIRTGNWESKTAGLGVTRYGSLEYFPELNGLVYVFGGDVYLYGYSSGWSTIKTGLTMGGYHNVGAYSPVHKCLVFGGGTVSNSDDRERKLYKMDANKNITQLSDAPFSFGVHEALMTLEPVTGNFLFCNDSTLYYYDLAADSWTNLGKSFATRGSRTVVVPVSTYGVVCFLSDGSYPVLLYKYADQTRVDENVPAAQGNAPFISVSPNPFKSRVVITINKKLRVTSYELQIFDITGKQLETRNSKLATSNTVSWNASGLPSGIYIAKITAGQKTYSRRLILQK